MIFLIVPYMFAVVGIPLLMAIPFYFFNRFLVRKMRPRENGRNLLMYFTVTVISVFLYISLGIFMIIRVALVFR